MRVHLTSLDQIHNYYQHIYLQPHFDDALLSCGGTIALQVAAGQPVLIVTAFGGIPGENTTLSPFAAQIHQKMGLGLDASAGIQRRRQEDVEAASVVGAATLWLDYPDAIYRGSPALYQSDESLYGDVNIGDRALEEELASTLRNIHERAPLATIYAPLGVGHHVDHQLCYWAAACLAQQQVHTKFYEDFPYVAQAGTLEIRQQQLSVAMEPEVVESPGLGRVKAEAIEKYASQVPQLFGGEEQMRQALQAYSSSLPREHPSSEIERYWRWQS